MSQATMYRAQHHDSNNPPKSKTTFRQVSVSSNEKYAYAVTPDYVLFKLERTYHASDTNTLKGVWKKVETDMKVFDLSVGVDGTLYALSPSYELYEWNSSLEKFRHIKAPEEMRQVSVSHKGMLVCLDINSKLWLWDGSKLNVDNAEYKQGWNKLNSKKVKYVSISGDAKELWGIDMIDNTAVRFDFQGKEWVDFISPKFKDISVSDSGKFVYGLSEDGHHILKLDLSNSVKNWKNAKNDTNVFNNISCCDGSSLGIIQQGGVFELKKGTASKDSSSGENKNFESSA